MTNDESVQIPANPISHAPAKGMTLPVDNREYFPMLPQQVIIPNEVLVREQIKGIHTSLGVPTLESDLLIPEVGANSA
jgi:hypothetical protein